MNQRDVFVELDSFGRDFIAILIWPTADVFDMNCLPGSGSILAMVQTASQRTPDIICGKPNRPMFDALVSKYNINPHKTLMIGDRSVVFYLLPVFVILYWYFLVQRLYCYITICIMQSWLVHRTASFSRGTWCKLTIHLCRIFGLTPILGWLIHIFSLRWRFMKKKLILFCYFVI